MGQKKAKRNQKKHTAATSHFVAAFHLEELRFALLALSVKEKIRIRMRIKIRTKRRNEDRINLILFVQGAYRHRNKSMHNHA